MSAPATIPSTEQAWARVARLNRVLELLQAVDEDARDAADFVRYGDGATDRGGRVLLADLTEIRALIKDARETTGRLIAQQTRI